MHFNTILALASIAAPALAEPLFARGYSTPCETKTITSTYTKDCGYQTCKPTTVTKDCPYPTCKPTKCPDWPPEKTKTVTTTTTAPCYPTTVTKTCTETKTTTQTYTKTMTSCENKPTYPSCPWPQVYKNGKCCYPPMPQPQCPGGQNGYCSSGKGSYCQWSEDADQCQNDGHKKTYCCADKDALSLASSLWS